MPQDDYKAKLREQYGTQGLGLIAARLIECANDGVHAPQLLGMVAEILQDIQKDITGE